jgi:hypothetical protein
MTNNVKYQLNLILNIVEIFCKKDTVYQWFIFLSQNLCLVILFYVSIGYST